MKDQRRSAGNYEVLKGLKFVNSQPLGSHQAIFKFLSPP